MTGDSGDKTGNGGDFESPLDELFVEGARYKEPSAAERRDWARRSEAAAKRKRKKERREQRKGSLRRFAPLLVLAAVVAVVWFLQNRGGEETTVAGPDEVRVVYALPSDAQADADVADAIRNEISVVDGWFGEQAGRTPDWIDDDGTVSVETVKLGVSSSVLANRSDAGSIVADEFRDENGNLPDDEVVLVLVPFEHDKQCGESGEVIVVWMGTCGTPSESTTELIEGVSATLAHEIVHAMGAVQSCAPNYGMNGHVIDNPNDIMYDQAEGGPRRATTDYVLDPGNDDYYDHGDGDCWDISDSPLWD